VEAEELIVVIISSLGILSGVAVIWMAMQSRRQIREMEHRERLAMIERGLMPPPELDPGAFERKFAATRTPASPGATRARSDSTASSTCGSTMSKASQASAGASSSHTASRAPVARV